MSPDRLHLRAARKGDRTMSKKSHWFISLVASVVLAASAQAHIVGLGWTFEPGGQVTFDALHWHGSHAAAGALIVDGTSYNFTSVTWNQATMTGLDGALTNPSYSTFAGGTLTALSVDDWLHVTIPPLGAGSHTVTALAGPGQLTQWTLSGGVTGFEIVTPPENGVSEPGTIGLLALGLIGVAFARRRS